MPIGPHKAEPWIFSCSKPSASNWNRAV